MNADIVVRIKIVLCVTRSGEGKMQGEEETDRSDQINRRREKVCWLPVLSSEQHRCHGPSARASKLARSPVGDSL